MILEDRASVLTLGCPWARRAGVNVAQSPDRSNMQVAADWMKPLRAAWDESLGY